MTLASGLSGYIHNDMLRHVDDMLEEFSVGTELEARVLYVSPTVNTIILTLRDVRMRDVFQGLNQGQLVEGAVVEKVSIKFSMLHIK